MHEMGDPERGTIVRSARRATWLAVVMIGMLARVRPRIARTLAFAFIGTLGIAHGATDDALLHRIGYRPRGGRVALSLTYGSLAIVTFIAARRAPKTAARTLFALSWLHFGSGDVAFARACGSGAHPVYESFLRGALPLCIAGTDVRSRGVAMLACLVAARHATRGEYADALDLALPTLLLLLTPRRFGFAIYFGTWHAVRHTALLLERDSRGGTFAGRARRYVRESFGNVAIALTTAAVAFAASPAISTRRAGGDAEDVIGALILAITVPHQIAVWLFERRSSAL